MKTQEDNYRAFDGLNMSNARSEDETYEQYKKRLKMVKEIMKLYNTIGRDAFREMFPAGVHEAAKDSMEATFNADNE